MYRLCIEQKPYNGSDISSTIVLTNIVRRSVTSSRLCGSHVVGIMSGTGRCRLAGVTRVVGRTASVLIRCGPVIAVRTGLVYGLTHSVKTRPRQQ